MEKLEAHAGQEKKVWIPRSSDRRRVYYYYVLYTLLLLEKLWMAPHEKKRKWWVSAREAFFQLGITRAPGYLVARQSSKMANAKAFSSSGSDSSESSSSSLTTSHRKSTTVVQQRRNSEGPRTLQSLVRTKCWSIAPLWKFVTYELETAPTKPTTHPKVPSVEKLSRSASFRPKKTQKQVKTSLFIVTSFFAISLVLSSLLFLPYGFFCPFEGLWQAYSAKSKVTFTFGNSFDMHEEKSLSCLETASFK